MTVFVVILPHRITKIINHIGKVNLKGKVSECLSTCYPLRMSSVACTSIYLSTCSRIFINTQSRIAMFQAGMKHEIPGEGIFFPRPVSIFGTE